MLDSYWSVLSPPLAWSQSEIPTTGDQITLSGSNFGLANTSFTGPIAQWLAQTGRNVSVNGAPCVVVEGGWDDSAVTCIAPADISQVCRGCLVTCTW